MKYTWLHLVCSLLFTNIFSVAYAQNTTNASITAPFTFIEPISQDDKSVAYPHENEVIGSVVEVYDGALFPDIQVNTFRNIHRLFPTRTVHASSTPLKLPIADRQLQSLSFISRGKTWDLYDYLSLNRVSGIIVIKEGQVAFEQYLLGNSSATKWMSMSVVKSMLATLVGVAIHDGLITNIDDPVTQYLPELAGSAYEEVSVRHLLQMASGVSWNEQYTDPKSDRRAMLEAQISQKSGAILELMAGLGRDSTPGTNWNYSTGETQVVAALVAAATGKPVADYLSEKIWQPFGMESDATWWLDSSNGLEIGGSGLSATLRDYARFGLYMLNEGKIKGESTLPSYWISQATQAQTINNKTIDYGYMWWPLNEGAYAAIGIFGQFIYVHPTSKTVIAMWSAQPKPVGTDVIDEFAFFQAVVAALH